MMAADTSTGAASGAMVAPWFKLGYVIPHLYSDIDAYQFYRVAPDGMLLVTTGLDLAEYSLAAVEQELRQLDHRLDILRGKVVDRIALSGVPVASALGRTRTLELLDHMAQRSGLPCDTDLEAHIAALKHLCAERIALATRWPEPVLTSLTAYLAAAGIRVVAARSHGRNLAQNKASSPAAGHELALALGAEALRAAPDAQALLLPGGLWFAIHAVEPLEREFGVPVLLNITAITWAALRQARAAEQRFATDARWGRLLAQAAEK
jgi:maleate cis-trans isomerase